ncbi:crossover junction endodeoxyribonuclease RuvC [Candidatus Marinamargulisbacteria bacterium SCGC AAA071-K20]|nr:crossover junction endodeoxyribonuclease RuvC [Candidatus Marinamargulisbacteria bacterium SCGC AAA071-K20]
MRILGIDPGYAILGFGILEKTGSKLKCIDYGVIRTLPKQDHSKRLHIIHKELCKLYALHDISDVAVEKIFFSNNTKTAMNVAQSRGIALLSAEQHNCKVFGYTPPQIKMGVSGYGKADKKQVQAMVKMLLGLNEIPKPDDAADALATAICHANSSKIVTAVAR